jgi:diguanylate cyclase (GGDEF)-like protein
VDQRPNPSIAVAMKILLAEDSKVYRALIENLLKDWGFDLVVAENGQQAWEILRQPEGPCLVLLDWMLPGIDGLELCQRIRAMPTSGRYIYTLLLTARDKKADLIAALEAGADDYLAKPFDHPELRLRLMAGKRLLELHEELVGARESLLLAATRDSLTGLLNRAESLAFLDRELFRCRRNKSPVAVLLIDVDHFKAVNDFLGHLAGDAVLREVAKRLTFSLRPYDGAGRYGGEEFLLMLPGCDLESATRRGEEIRNLICRSPVITPAGERVITISLGVTAADASTAKDHTVILGVADKALYRAKNNGRNRTEAIPLSGAAVATQP